MTAPAPARRFYSLDILRGIAVLLVLVRHMPMPRESSSLGWRAVRVVYDAGWSGVDLFFVLSGFLISGLLFQELRRSGELRLGRFWLRRGFKIWPAYFAAYGVTVLLKAAHSAQSGDPEQTGMLLRSFLSNGLFFQNYAGELRWPHSWSIAVEEHFYFTMPVLLAWLAARSRLRLLLPAGAAVCALVLGLRLALAYSGETRWERFYYPTHLRADTLCAGVMLGYLYHRQRPLFLKLASHRAALLAPLVPAFALAAAFPIEQSNVVTTIGFTVFAIAYGGLVVLAGAHPDLGRKGPALLVWAARAAAALGVYSYCIYLAHSVLYWLPGASSVRAALSRGRLWPDLALYWISSVAGGVALSHLVERPMLRLRDRIASRASSPQAQAA